jgi:hypothetical protein
MALRLILFYAWPVRSSLDAGVDSLKQWLGGNARFFVVVAVGYRLEARFPVTRRKRAVRITAPITAITMLMMRPC